MNGIFSENAANIWKNVNEISSTTITCRSFIVSHVYCEVELSNDLIILIAR